MYTHYSHHPFTHPQLQGGYDMQSTMVRKRKRAGLKGQTISNSEAAKFNARTLRKLQAAVSHDPEIDLATQMPINYSSRLSEMRASKDAVGQQSEGYIGPMKMDNYPLVETSNDNFQEATNPEEADIRESLNPSDTVHIIFPLSQEVLKLVEDVSKTAGPLPNGLSQRLFEVMRASEVLWKAPVALRKMVLKCTADIVVKAVRDMDDYTEYTTLQYLEQHIPDCPAPRPLGCVRMSEIWLIFLTHKPSTSLGEIWHALDHDQKSSVRDQLEAIITKLRSLPYVDGRPLGGVAGEGCKDARRHLRRSDKPIKTLGAFEDFLFSSSRPGGLVFLELLRQLSPCLPSPSNIVFTHGDLRPDNITVEIIDHNCCVVTGLLDWEYSGFYPEYYKAVRCTNCLTLYDDNDWFLFLPDCILLKRYAHWWLLDRVREARSM